MPAKASIKRFEESGLQNNELKRAIEEGSSWIRLVRKILTKRASK